MPLFGTIEKNPGREDEVSMEEGKGGPWDDNYAEQLGIKKKEKKNEVRLENPMKGPGGEKIPGKTGKIEKETADFGNPLGGVEKKEIEKLINDAFSKDRTS